MGEQASVEGVIKGRGQPTLRRKNKEKGEWPIAAREWWGKNASLFGKEEKVRANARTRPEKREEEIDSKEKEGIELYLVR